MLAFAAIGLVLVQGCSADTPEDQPPMLGMIDMALNSCFDETPMDCAPPSNPNKIFVCHAVASDPVGYVKIETSANANGHVIGQAHGNMKHQRPDLAPGTFGLACNCQPRTCGNVCVGAVDGTPCQDSGCNKVGFCSAGVCVSEPIDCASAGDACNAPTGECVGMGQCVTQPRDDGTACDDDSVCNGRETCLAGVCVAGTPPSCDDDDACTSDSCDPVVGCVAAALDCSDHDECTADSCDSTSGCVNTLVSCESQTGCFHTDADGGQTPAPDECALLWCLDPYERTDEGECVIGLVGERTVEAPGRWRDGTYASSCEAYRRPAAPYAYWGSTGDGVYAIELAGGLTLVHCDMTTRGGGWTQIDSQLSTLTVGKGTASWSGSDIVGTGGGGFCNNPRRQYTLSAPPITYDEVYVLLRRTTSVLQCSYITPAVFASGWYTPPYDGTYTPFATCIWELPWANTNWQTPTNMANVKLDWVLFAVGENTPLYYDTLCSTWADTGAFVMRWFVR